MNELYTFAATYAMKRPVRINIRLPSKLPTNMIQFSDLCVKYNILDLYIWLSWRFPQFFVEKETCMQQRAYALALIEETLMSTGSTFITRNSLNDDYSEMRRKLGNLTGNTFLPPDLDDMRSIRASTKMYLEQLSSLNPTFRRKHWGKVGEVGEVKGIKSSAINSGNTVFKKKIGVISNTSNLPMNISNTSNSNISPSDNTENTNTTTSMSMKVKTWRKVDTNDKIDPSKSDLLGRSMESTWTKKNIKNTKNTLKKVTNKLSVVNHSAEDKANESNVNNVNKVKTYVKNEIPF